MIYRSILSTDERGSYLPVYLCVKHVITDVSWMIQILPYINFPQITLPQPPPKAVATFGFDADVVMRQLMSNETVQRALLALVAAIVWTMFTLPNGATHREKADHILSAYKTFTKFLNMAHVQTDALWYTSMLMDTTNPPQPGWWGQTCVLGCWVLRLMYTAHTAHKFLQVFFTPPKPSGPSAPQEEIESAPTSWFAGKSSSRKG